MALAHSPRIVTSGLILALDAGNLKSYPGSGTSWFDLSGNGNTGTLVNGPTFSATDSGAIIFDGIDDRVDCLNLSAVTNHTIEMWILDTRSTAFNSADRDILTYNGNSGAYTFANKSLGGSTFRTDGNALGARSFSSIVQPTQSQWYRFCYVKNGDLWINQTRYTGTGTDRTYGVISFGNTRSDVNNRLAGRISNVRIYNRNLTDAEIAQNFNALRGRYGI